MYGEIVVFYEIAVHFCIFNISVRGRGKPLPYAIILTFFTAPKPVVYSV